MIDTIFIEQLEIETIIGIYDSEREQKQKIMLDIQMQYDTAHARATDNINYALDYHKLSDDLFEFVQESSYELIETLAEAVASRILNNNTNVLSVKLRLSKPDALLKAKNVGILIERKQNDYQT